MDRTLVILGLLPPNKEVVIKRGGGYEEVKFNYDYSEPYIPLAPLYERISPLGMGIELELNDGGYGATFKSRGFVRF